MGFATTDVQGRLLANVLWAPMAPIAMVWLAKTAVNMPTTENATTDGQAPYRVLVLQAPTSPIAKSASRRTRITRLFAQYLKRASHSGSPLLFFGDDSLA